MQAWDRNTPIFVVQRSAHSPNIVGSMNSEIFYNFRIYFVLIQFFFKTILYIFEGDRTRWGQSVLF